MTYTILGVPYYSIMGPNTLFELLRALRHLNGLESADRSAGDRRDHGFC